MTGFGFRKAAPVEPDRLVPEHRLEEISAYGMDGARDAAGRRPNGLRFRGRLAQPLVAPLAAHAQPWKYTPVMLIDPETGAREPHLFPLEGGRS